MMLAAGLVYAGLGGILVLFQIALALGAPWGHLAMGGQWPGRYPPRLRVLALVQGALLAGMGWAVATRAGLTGAADPASWPFWGAMAITVLTTVLNLITPSLPERRLWGPVTVVMLIAGIVVAIG
ncbi:MAG: hypothetical protein ACWA5A_16115 [Marinibacterium sp.]